MKLLKLSNPFVSIAVSETKVGFYLNNLNQPLPKITPFADNATPDQFIMCWWEGTAILNSILKLPAKLDGEMIKLKKHYHTLTYYYCPHLPENIHI